jgi:hypothetical protein
MRLSRSETIRYPKPQTPNPKPKPQTPYNN